MKIGVTSSILCVVALAALTCLPLCAAQSTLSRDQWGEQFDSTGAALTYKEVERTKAQGRTVVTYNLFSSGLPRDQHYVLYILNVGSDPRPAADAYLNGNGKVVNMLADPEHHVAEDPINLKVFGGKGEPIQFALVSDDDQLRAFTEIIPFPIEKTAGLCHLSAIETAPYYFGIFIRVTGFQPNEELDIMQRSENEGAQSKAKADDRGMYAVGLFPFVKAKKSGTARFGVAAKSCNIGIEIPWGEGSYKYQ